MRLRYTTLEKANYKLIEFELYHYHQSKKIYQQHEDDIIHGSGQAPEIRGTQISKTTESKAIRLLSNLHLTEMKKRIDAIEFVLHIVPSQKLELIKEKYFVRRLTDYGIMQKLHIEKSTYYAYKKQVIQLIADRLGWLV
jgi:RinA family phage transcriptional activator